VNANGDRPAPGLIDAADRSRFGFDSDEDVWLARCRDAVNGPAPASLGPYQLTGDAGRGSQGSVYKAVQPGTGRIIAIKRLGAGRFATPSMRARFELEILALASLSHPGIVTVFGADEVDGQRIIVMEWIDGLPIDEWARAKTLRERLGLFSLTCDAVAHAHRRGVIHRDLKPSNILVDRNDRPHVLDFGLARLAADDRGPAISHTGAFVGTPAYAAPEQLTGRSQDIDTRTDVYALGVILYELVTGTRPIEYPTDLGALVDAIRDNDPRPPTSLNPEIGAEIDAIVLKALAKEPGLRYQSVSDLGDDIRRHLAGETVLAHPPRRIYRLQKLVRRNRTGVIACAAIVLALVGGAAATTLQAVRATRAEKQMAGERDTARIEARRADAVRDFLTTMLADAAPHAGSTPDMTVRQALDKAAAKLDGGFLKDQPETEEAIRWSLAGAYSPLGLRKHAAAQYEWILRHREKVNGPDHPKVADALYWWGGELNASGLLDQAESALRRSLDIYQKAGPGKWHRLHPLMMLADLDRKGGRSVDAVSRYKELIREFEKIAPKNAGELAWSHYCLGLAYRDLGRHDECVAAFERARPMMAKSLRPGTRQQMWFAIAYTTEVLESAERHQDTVEFLQPLLDSTIEPFGIDDRDVSRVVILLSRALIGRGDGAAAEPLLRKLLVARERRLAPDDVRVLTTRSVLGSALAQSGRLSEAEPLLISAFEGLDTKPDVVERSEALRAVVLFYECLGRDEEAAFYRSRF
jgi:eukaryotic-like serine/threonine-protein kinase